MSQQDRKPISVLIAEPKPITAYGLAHIVSLDPRYRTIGVVFDGRDCLSMIRTQAPEIALIAVALPALSGWEILARLRETGLGETSRATRIVLLAESVGFYEISAALDAGAFGVLHLHLQTVHQGLHHCLASVADGVKWASPMQSSTLPTGPHHRMAPPSSPSRTPSRSGERLTGREQEIAMLVADGLSNKAIGRRLGVSDGTVRIHLHNVFRKTGVKNRTELAQLAVVGVPQQAGVQRHASAIPMTSVI
jgi:DNA-binding NarL/FixJ family response regulator